MRIIRWYGQTPFARPCLMTYNSTNATGYECHPGDAVCL